MTDKKHVLLGVTGGIAAYKSAQLTRLLVQEGLQVRIVMSRNATRFITPLTLEVLSGHPVSVEMFVSGRGGMEHIELGLWPDVAIIAPATANILGKLANGIADDLISTTFLALRPETPLVVAPAMNTRMWNNPAVQRNVSLLAADRGRRCVRVGPAEKRLACGEEGVGAMADPSDVLVACLICLGRHPVPA